MKQGLTAQAFSCVSVQSELSPDEFQMMSSIENGLCYYNLFLGTTIYSWELELVMAIPAALTAALADAEEKKKITDTVT